MKESNHKYFSNLNEVLREFHRAIPTLLLDLDLLDYNINVLKGDINSLDQFRIVVKSLPSPELIQYIAEHTGTNRYMIFHQPILSDMINSLDDGADVLLGKPMPVTTAQYFYDSLQVVDSNFDPFHQIQWLVDTELRIQQYIQLAKKLGKSLRLNIELDVGLHRGGINDLRLLSHALRLIEDHQVNVNFSGFMGYDPHIVKVPSILRSQKKSLDLANGFYNDCLRLLHSEFPKLIDSNLTFNGAGSPTIGLHHGSTPLNDIAAGSCLMKPTTFDIPTLRRYKPAAFIATPVLKKMIGTTIPGLESWRRVLSMLRPKYKQSFFIYGGFWKADYYYPARLASNKLYGESTNQTMINAPKHVQLDVDDFVFLRPHQSESVFLQFGEILPIRRGAILKPWSLLKQV